MAHYSHDCRQGDVAGAAAQPVTRDTIAAVATPAGVGGIGIVRVSGPNVRQIAQAAFGLLPQPRHASYVSFQDAAQRPIDRGIALFFPTPYSYTGEDVLEFQGHGGPVVLELVLRRAIELGARLARPGEFSERAFLNGKLDLTQAEAVADLIESSSEAAVRSALRSLDGRFSERIHELVQQLVDLRTYIEASIDFPEDEIDLPADDRLANGVASVMRRLDELLESTRQGCLLHDGMTVVLAGPPNAGKSSLLNLLVEHDAAIVSATPGTTRDVLRERVAIDGLPIHILDTAGLRDSGDEIETEGVRRALAAMGRADRILLVVDDCVSNDGTIENLRRQLPKQPPHTLIRNKIDLSGRQPGETETKRGTEVALSAKNAHGLEFLRKHLKACMGFQVAGEGTFIARRRHLDAIQRAREHVQAGKDQFEQRRAGELLAEELRLAQRALSEITGEFTTEDLLERIFSSFCIGK